MTTRRGVLKLVGGGCVLAAGGIGAFVAANEPSRSARAPWREAGQETEFRRSALSYAILAPNPHNRQPWLVRLDGDDALTLYCNLDRRLPATDPHDRQIVIGHGTFLELLALAAAEDGYGTEITSFPDGEDMTTLDTRPVASVKFIAEAGEPGLGIGIGVGRAGKGIGLPRADRHGADLGRALQRPVGGPAAEAEGDRQGNEDEKRKTHGRSDPGRPMAV